MEETKEDRKGWASIARVAVLLMGLFNENGRMLFNRSIPTEIGRLLDVLARQEEEGEQGFIFKYADPKYFKKVRLRILEGLAETWYMIKKALKIPYHSSLAPIWNSLGSPEWTKDALAVPLLDAGITRWENIIQNGQLLSWEMCKQKLDSKVSRFKYLQVQSWFHASGTIIGERNELEDRLMLETVLKKELACTYWLMVGLEDGAFTLPLDLWGRCFPETALEHQW